MEIIVSSVIVLLLLALIVTIIKYPKDVGKGLLFFLLAPFRRIWDMVMLILLPLQFIVLIIESRLKVNYLSKYIDATLPSYYKTKSRKPINFIKFNKYIVINHVSTEIVDQIKEAKETCPEVSIEQLKLTKSEHHSVVELPIIGFYGFNYLIQWLTEHFKNYEVYGFSTNGRSKFLTYNDINGENSLIGLTNTGKKFWINMYDDLDNKQFLRLNEELKVDTTLTTESLELMIEKAI